MNVSRALGVQLSDTQVKSLLAGKKILVKGNHDKKYDTELRNAGVKSIIKIGIAFRGKNADFSYTKDGKEIKGSQYKFKMEFPPRKVKQG